MPKFLKKPVERVANQFLGDWVEGLFYDQLQGAYFCVTAQDQIVYVKVGEWIIKEPSGNGYYPCADAIFRAEYTLIKE